MKVRNYEDIAVVTLCVDASGLRGVTAFSGKLRNIRIFRKDRAAPHGWKCNMWFNSKIGG